jgi:hypothetical protein
LADAASYAQNFWGKLGDKGGLMSQLSNNPLPTIPTRPFRIDVPLHELLQTSSSVSPLPAVREIQFLPEPVFPQHPQLMQDLTAEEISEHQKVVETGQRHWPASYSRHHARLDVSVFQIAYSAGRLPADHLLPFHRLEMQSGLPLLLVLRQSRKRDDRRHGAASD